MSDTPSCTAFQSGRRIAAGSPAEVALALRGQPAGAVQIFDDATGRELDFDLRGSAEEVRARLEPPRAPGRPRLGVVAREVTLLPRHWEWLAAQPGGASIALRKLVEAGMADPRARAAAARQAADRFMAAAGGDLPGYEAATRALYAGDRAGFLAPLRAWPADLREHALHLAEPGFAPA